MSKFEIQKTEYYNHLNSLPPVSETPAITLLLSSKRSSDLLSILNQIKRFNYPNYNLALGLHQVKLEPEHKKIIKALEKKNAISVVKDYGQDFNLGKILSDLGNHVKTPLFAKIDDDDFYSENYLTELQRTMASTESNVIGKALNYIYLSSIDSTILRINNLSVSNPYQFDSWVCGGTIMGQSNLAQKVGWFGEFGSGVDKYFLGESSNLGAKIYRTHGYGYIYTRNNLTHTYNTVNNKYLNGASALGGGLYQF